MSEIRKHYFLDEYCIIAPNRSFRPSDFKKTDEASNNKECIFCPGSEEKTPPATAVYTSKGVTSDKRGVVHNWKVRCIPNMYPVLSLKKSSSDRFAEGFGFHEVIIETPGHDYEPSMFLDEEIIRLIRVYADRYTFYINKDGIEFVSLFKNYGSSAGASIAHSHSQLIALPLIPPIIKKEMVTEYCPFCSIIQRESVSKRLILMQNDWIAFAPYFSRYPFEVWIAPKEHFPDLSKLSDVSGLAFMLRNVLSRMRALFGSVAYNYMFFQCTDDRYHFHLKVFPKLSVTGGFEENTSIYVNPVSPEDAAAWLRQ